MDLGKKCCNFAADVGNEGGTDIPGPPEVPDFPEGAEESEEIGVLGVI